MPSLDDKEFASLLESEGRALRSFLLALVSDRHLMEDMHQSTCLELWRIRKTFRRGTDFGAWSRTVARYQVLRHWKRARLERRLFSTAALDAVEEAYRDPAERLAEAEAHDALQSCLESLPEDSRSLLEARYSRHTTLHEVAATRGVSEASLKMRLVRIRQRLADCVRKKTSRVALREARPHDARE